VAPSPITRTGAAPCARQGAVDDVAHRDDVVPVHLLAREPGRDRLLGQRGRGRLGAAGQRDGPLVVGHDEDRGQPPGARHVQRLVEVALRGGAVAHYADRYPRLAPQPEREGDPDRMRGLAGDRHADREVLARPAEVAAPLVSAPVEEQLGRRDSAEELGALLAGIGQEHVVRRHGRAESHRHRFLAQAGRVGAEPPGALQRDRLRVEGACQHHRAIQGDERLTIAREGRQRLLRMAGCIEVSRVGDVERRDRGHCYNHDTITTRCQTDLAAVTFDRRSGRSGASSSRDRSRP